MGCVTIGVIQEISTIKVTPMAETESFADLLSRLRVGDQAAAAQIFRGYASRLIALARSHLNARMRRQVDPEDVVQSVFKSFFARHDDGAFHLKSWGDLWSLLACITLRKCGHCVERLQAARRDIRRDQIAIDAGDSSAAAWEPLARDPSPSEAAMLVDTVETLMRELVERDRRILMLSLQGCAIPDISEQVGCTERTVYRVLDWIKKRLEEFHTSTA
jgi:RNA polymerase sigma-70 factor (ECF subfamily)